MGPIRYGASVHTLLAAFLLGCQTQSIEPHLQFRSNAFQHTTSIFTLYYTTADERAARDVARALEAQLPRLRKDLQYDYRHPVTVEIYPNQPTYDAHLMSASVKGSPACSGRRTIQMVSPNSPIRITAIPYNERVGMAVHELAHLFLNEINASLPVWLQEGIASFEGGADWYRRICRLPEVAGFLRNPPSLAALESSYGSVVAADVFSFMFVDFIVTRNGTGALNRLIRNPADFEEAFGFNKAETEVRWHEFIRTRTGNGLL